MKINVQEYNRRKYYKSASKLFRQILNSYLADYLIRCEGADINTLRTEADKPLQKEPIQDAMIRLYSKVGADFAKAQIKEIQLKKSMRADIVTKADKPKPIEIDFWEEYFKRYAIAHAGAKITIITGTTEEIFKATINKIITNNPESGVFDLLKMIQAELEVTNQYRAERIARTEVNAASNRGGFEGAKQAGISVKKIWSAVIDDATRQSHIDNEADGAIEMNAAFSNGQTMPGEGDAEEVINCRCGLIYITEDDPRY